jgi:hypothetical protein
MIDDPCPRIYARAFITTSTGVYVSSVKWTATYRPT